MVKLLFLTSNRTKIQHACYLARDYDLTIVKQPNYGVVYKEPRTSDRDTLIKKSIEDAKNRLFKQNKRENKIFFIEDTSVIIHALSTRTNEVPGTEIKFWMQEHDFKQVDRILKEHGNNRNVTVRSDVLLYLPSNLRETENEEYKQFTSEANGIIIEKEHRVKTNDLYPWLDNRTFNKWFVPNGCKIPISMLSMEEADKHDFRAKAFKDMLDFLEKKRIIWKKGNATTKAEQKTFPFFTFPSFLVCGMPCAGKTTLGNYLNKNCAYYHIEASDFMCMSYYDCHGLKSSVKISDFAEKALKEKPGIVAEQAISHLSNIKNVPFILTGFRSSEELEIFKKIYGGGFTIEEIYIDADVNKRYERDKIRKRREKAYSKKEFDERDKQQLRMGLGHIKDKLRTNVIQNNEDFESYFQAFHNKYKEVIPLKNVPSYNYPQNRPKDLEDAILMALSNKEVHFTTTEIAHEINKCFPNSKIITSKNNVSRYFNQYFHPHYEIIIENDKIKYGLSPTGKSKAWYLLEYLYKQNG